MRTEISIVAGHGESAMNEGPWSDEEWRHASQLIDGGHAPKVIAQLIGRSYDSLLGKMRYEAMDDEQRQARHDRINAWRRRDGGDSSRKVNVANRPTNDILAERDRYLSAPRTLSQLLLGDPPPGYSALDRKRMGGVGAV